MSTYQAASEAIAAGLQPAPPLTTTTDPGVQALAEPFSAADSFSSTLADVLGSSPPSNPNILASIDGPLGTPSVLNAINGGMNTAAWFVTAIPTAVSLGHTLAGAAVPAAAVSDVASEAAPPASSRAPWCGRSHRWAACP
ncbi:hypothetical protein [Mycobacterium tilburgii]|uniref:hypothetical protein n=1 Tax=Mycobacterium tilburgii TaxID=44467 RepID=UPI0021B331DC|nr:hypothetical protein [Mycobacterium tilburgii]